MENKTTNLFVYGTLMNDNNIFSICGKTFEKQKGFLKNYSKRESRSGFPYIIRKRGSRTYGYILYDVDIEALKRVDIYEDRGVLYDRIPVKVYSKKKEVFAETYIGNVANFRRVFGDKIDLSVTKRVEKYLREKIGEVIPIEISDETRHIQERIKKEIYGVQIKHLLDTFYFEKTIAQTSIKQELEFFKQPELKEITADDEKLPFISNYLKFLFLFTLFNQIEEKFRYNFRDTFNPHPFYPYSISITAALKFLNAVSVKIKEIFNEPFFNNFMNKDYNYYLKKAILYSDKIYDSGVAGAIVKEMARRRQRGHAPLGCELEFSNLGCYCTSAKPPYFDCGYNNFKYFNDFDLLRRCWKTGGHIDDHTLTDPREKKGGFLEFSLGRNSIFTSSSQPATNDVYILSEFIKEMTEFIDVCPHSLHISIEYDKKVEWTKKNNVDYLKCLLILGGDIKGDGNFFKEKRISSKEIIDRWGHLNFLIQNRHSVFDPGVSAKKSVVMEYQFPRLQKGKNYEELITALKGFQYGYNLRPLHTRLENSPVVKSVIKEEMAELSSWSENVQPVSSNTISEFIGFIEKGLLTEKNGKSAHSKKYIERKLFNIEKKITLTNYLIK